MNFLQNKFYVNYKFLKKERSLQNFPAYFTDECLTFSKLEHRYAQYSK